MKNSLHNETSIVTQEYHIKDIGNITLTTSSELLNEVSRVVPSGQFQPYAYSNLAQQLVAEVLVSKDTNSIQAYFKDESCYTKTLNNNIELYISFKTGEVVGINILNVQQLIQAHFFLLNKEGYFR